MTIINKIIDGKMYAEKLLGEIHPLSKGFLIILIVSHALLSY